MKHKIKKWQRRAMSKQSIRYWKNKKWASFFTVINSYAVICNLSECVKLFTYLTEEMLSCNAGHMTLYAYARFHCCEVFTSTHMSNNQLCILVFPIVNMFIDVLSLHSSKENLIVKVLFLTFRKCICRRFVRTDHGQSHEMSTNSLYCRNVLLITYITLYLCQPGPKRCYLSGIPHNALCSINIIRTVIKLRQFYTHFRKFQLIYILTNVN